MKISETLDAAAQVLIENPPFYCCSCIARVLKVPLSQLDSHPAFIFFRENFKPEDEGMDDCDAWFSDDTDRIKILRAAAELAREKGL